jgi:hypothetical protein
MTQKQVVAFTNTLLQGEEAEVPPQGEPGRAMIDSRTSSGTTKPLANLNPSARIS